MYTHILSLSRVARRGPPRRGSLSSLSYIIALTLITADKTGNTIDARAAWTAIEDEDHGGDKINASNSIMCTL